MSLAKVLAIRSNSPKSFDDAVRSGIARVRAEKSPEWIQGAWVAGQKLEVENGVVTTYRVDMRVAVITR